MNAHGKENRQRIPGPLVPPIQIAAAYHFPDSAALAATHDNKLTAVRYARDTSETQQDLEQTLESYFRGFRALVFDSGMSAIDALLRWGWARYELLWTSPELYRKTELLIDDLNVLRPKSIQRLPVAHRESSGTLSADTPPFVFLEIPTNPHLRLAAPQSVKSVAGSEAFVAADLTLSGLDNLRAEQLAALDAIVISLTKYISGHNDLIGGVLFVRDSLFQEFWELRSRLGTILGPFEAYLTSRSLKTYALRWEAQQENARQVVAFLSDKLGSGEVTSLFYPGEGSNADQFEVATKVLEGSGSVVSFVPNCSRDILASRMDRLRTIRMAPSFGSVDSLIEISSLMSHPAKTLDELKKQGLEPALLRLSVGLETPGKVIEDLRALLAP